MHDEYAAYDPVEVLGLRASAPEDTPAQTPDAEALPVFDERHREPFTGLIYLGALTRSFDMFGHRFVLRTLKADEKLEIGPLTQKYLGTLAEPKAYVQAVVAMALVTVDGKELPVIPLGDSSSLPTWAAERFAWIGEHYYDTVIGALYQQYEVLQDTVDQVLDALGKALGQPA